MDTLSKYRVDICGLSEVRWAGSGRVKVAGYDVFYSGSEKGGMYGVGVAIRSNLAESVTAWEPVNDRLMWMRFNAKNVPTTIVSVYAPTEVADSNAKDDFYRDLDRILKDVPSRDFLIVLGDFNARVGCDDKTWRGVVGKHGVYKESNDNGRRLVDICAFHDMCVTGTLFQHKDIHKYTRYQWGSNVGTQIDHVVVRRCWRSSVCDTRVYRGADFCNSDHRLVVSEMRVRLSNAKKPKQELVDVDRLKSQEKAIEFELNIGNRFGALTDEVTDAEGMLGQLKKTLVASAKEVCGMKKRRKPVWLTDDVVKLAEEKAKLFVEWQSSSNSEPTREAKYAEYRDVNRACIKATKKAKRMVWARKGEELEEEARRNNTRAVYQKLNELRGKSGAVMDLLKDTEGNFVREAGERRQRWKQHFEKHLNEGYSQHQMAPSEVVENRRTQYEVDEELPPSEDDVERAIKRLKNNKAAGCDEINAEMLKAGGKVVVQWMHRLICKIWQDEVAPEDWRKAIIVPLYKKGDKSVCDNWRGISLLSVTGKVYAHLLLERLVAAVDGKISETQSGFRKARGCADQIFTLRRVMEQAREKKKSLYMCFIDLKAAYDTVRREDLWLAVEEYGASSKLCRLIKTLYVGTQAAVRVEGELTDWFEVKTGLRQGCLLSPALFNVFIDRVVRRAFAGMNGGVRVEYRLPDGRAHLGDHVHGSVLLFDLLYADDMVIICESEEVLKEAVLRLEQATQDAGLTISVKKTKYLITKVDDRSVPDIDIVIRGEKVERVSEFVYLGTSINEDSVCAREVDRRIVLGTRAFNELRKPVWNQNGISLQTKMQIYRSVVLTRVLYGCESWTCTAREYASLNTFHNKNLRALLGRRRCEIRNDELYEKTGSCRLENYVRKYRLRWAGHVRRMGPDRIPKKILFGELAEGNRGRGRPKTNWKDCLEEDWEKAWLAKAEKESASVSVPPISKWTKEAEQRLNWQKLLSYLTPQKEK
jgi:exonuclease III